MGEDEGVEESDAAGDPRGEGEGDHVEGLRGDEECCDGGGGESEFGEEPEAEERFEDHAAGERVDGEEAGDGDDGTSGFGFEGLAMGALTLALSRLAGEGTCSSSSDWDCGWDAGDRSA